MKLQEILESSTNELVEKLHEQQQQLFTLRFQQKTGQLENGKVITEVRKTIARILTILKQRELEKKE